MASPSNDPSNDVNDKRSPPVEGAPRRPSSTPNSAAKVRRRNRVIASCLECRRRKLKCDKIAPCTNCTRFKRDCLYLAPTLDSVSQQKLADLKDRMGSLEHVLARDVARKGSADDTSSAPKNEDESGDEDVPEYDDEKDLELSPFAVIDQVYEADANDDDLMDLGVQLGKMRVSERIGGFVRPQFTQELGRYPRRGVTIQPGSAGRAAASRDPSLPVWLPNDSPATFLGPGPDYIAPASRLFFPSSQPKNPVRDYLPSRGICDKLLDHYWRNCHPLVTIVHKPSFLNVYELFWQDVMLGNEINAAKQAVLFGVLFNSAVSISDDVAFAAAGCLRAPLTERLQTGLEAALSRANFLRTTKLETMQAFVLYLVPLCRSEVSRAHSALTGTAIRLAECMGLHRDGSSYGFSAVETHVRRLVWHQLCFLDLRTCEATGPRPQIRKDEYDTKLPLNVNEVDLMQEPPVGEDAPYFTDLTLLRLRAECTEMNRQMWVDISRIEQKRIKVSAALAKIQKFKDDMERRYLPLFNGSDPRQLLALHIYRILSSRLFVMLLHRYFVGTKTPLPDRLRTILIDACAASCEFTISLETRIELAPWSWYRGAIQQYHTAMLILSELYTRPNTIEAPRYWRILDYIYEFPPQMTSEQKADAVIFALRDRLTTFQSMRRMRASKTAQEAFDSLQEPSGLATADEASMAGEPMNNSVVTTGYSTTTQMDANQFLSPMPSLDPSSSVTSSINGGYPGSSPAGANAMMLDEIDWSDWDKAFPNEESTEITGFGRANLADLPDLPDLNLGSYTPFVANVPPWLR